jgi:hypothetical protein
MFTIKRAARADGLTEATPRAWAFCGHTTVPGPGAKAGHQGPT